MLDSINPYSVRPLRNIHEEFTWSRKSQVLNLKFGDGDGPNLGRVNKVDVSSTFYWKHISVWVDPRQFLRLFLSLRLKTNKYFLLFTAVFVSLFSTWSTAMTELRISSCCGITKYGLCLWTLWKAVATSETEASTDSCSYGIFSRLDDDKR